MGTGFDVYIHAIGERSEDREAVKAAAGLTFYLLCWAVVGVQNRTLPSDIEEARVL